jgi:uncharacterized membrane protein
METFVIKFLRILLIGFYFFAGSYHFINPVFYIGLIPDYLHYPEFLNHASGFLEMVLAVGVAIPKTRLLAVKSIITLLVLFIPSHVYFIQIGSCVDTAFCVPPWVAWLRLLLVHPLLILWAWAVRKTN